MTLLEKDIIEQTKKFLKDRYGKDTSGHDWFHLERVWKMAKKLAKNYRINQFVLEMAALLHDVDDYKFKKEYEEALSGTLAILTQFSINKKSRDHILDIVSHVSFKGVAVPTVQKTLEGKIVQDADRLEAMGAIGIARVFAYGGSARHPYYDSTIKPHHVRTFSQYKTQKRTTINHFYEKLLLLQDRLNTPEAKKIGQRRHEFLKTYLAEFFAEVEGRA